MKNIVITNFYGYENIGDAAIFEIAIKVINKAIPENNIHVHTATRFIASEKKLGQIKTFLHPYGIAIRTKAKPISDSKKVTRFVTVIVKSVFYSLLGKISPNLLPTHGDYSYIKSLNEADLIFGIGGGYLRTKNKYKDYFGLTLTLLPLFIAHLYDKKVLYLPMSYGNFASKIQDKLAYNVIKNDAIIFRDEKSRDVFSKHTTKGLDTHLIPDLALFDHWKENKKSKKDYMVVTARLWMKDSEQKRYEKQLALFIDYVWESYKLKTVFIPMVWNKKEEDDTRVGKRILELLQNKKIFKIISVKNPEEVKKILAGAKVSISTRMHSAILSTIVNTPFITIAYEYKTVGFLKHLGLEKWNINIEDLSFTLIKEKFDDLMNKDYLSFKNQLTVRHLNILKKEPELVNIIKTFSK